MKKLLLSCIFFCALWTSNLWAHKNDYHLGFRVAPRVSTLGGGIEIAKGITPWFGLRGGANYFAWNFDISESGNDYDIDLELKSFGLFADLHPFKQAFRISVGFLINGNGLEGTAKLGPNETLELDGSDYKLLNNSASANLSYNTFAPYAGIGWDTTFGDDDRWGFAFDLGVVFSGSPDLALNAVVDSNDANIKKKFETDKNKEISEIQDDLNKFEFWPVISAGLVYQF